MHEALAICRFMTSVSMNWKREEIRVKKKKKVPVLFNRFHLRNDDLKDKDISIDESTFKRYGLEIELIRFL